MIGTVFSTPLTSTVPPLNSGLPVCVAPWMSFVSAGLSVGLTGVTVGVYVAEAFVPFLSSRTTVTAGAVPTNDSQVRMLQFHLPLQCKYQRRLLSWLLNHLQMLLEHLSLIGTVFSTPSTVTVPPLNSGLPF